MICTISTSKGVVLKSTPNGYFGLGDPGMVACGYCGNAVLTLLQAHHREHCTGPEQPTDVPEGTVAVLNIILPPEIEKYVEKPRIEKPRIILPGQEPKR